jgi:hypothetical protein
LTADTPKFAHWSFHRRRQDSALPPALFARQLHPPLPLRRQGARARFLAVRVRDPRARRHHRLLHPGHRWPLLTPDGDAHGPDGHQAAERPIPVQGPPVGAQLRHTWPGIERRRRLHHHRRPEERHWEAATGPNQPVRCTLALPCAR